MKIKFTLLYILFFQGFGFGQFSIEKEINYCDACSPNNILTVDLDGDKDLDVVASTIHDSKIIWYRNDGVGNFSSVILISSELKYPSSLISGDLDGDNYMDIIVTSRSENKVVWFKNDGKGNFSFPQVISDNIKGASDVATIDLDADGDLDIIAVASLDKTIYWLENQGKGELFKENLIAKSRNNLSLIKIADLNNDSKMDFVLTASYGKALIWYENLGNNEFSDEIIISSKNKGLHAFGIVDIDNDGNKDIICNYRDGFLYGKLMLYKNEGLGKFSESIVLESAANDIKSMEFSDLDKNGYLDIITFSEGSSGISWYKNNDTLKGFEKLLIADKLYLGESGLIKLADLNGDKRLDIVYAEKGDRIGWFKNNGHLAFKEHVDIAKNIEEADYIYPIDLDKDGDMDLIGALENKVAWFRNEGSDGFSNPIIIEDNLKSVTRVFPVDLDKNQTIDILYTRGFNNRVVGWYKNLGKEKFENKILFPSSYKSPYDIKSIDIENDNDLDIIYTSFTYVGKILLIKNVDGNYVAPIVLADSLQNVRTLLVNDFDLDGDSDIGFSSNHEIGWLENDGNGGFDTRHIISDAEKHAGNLFRVDLDGDNIKDILIKGSNIVWLKGERSGSFTSRKIISSPDGLNRKIYPCDVDGDQDLDIVFATFNLGKDAFGWYENKGDGKFTTEQIISTHSTPATSISVADFNNDGKPDVVYSGFWHGKIAWFKNIFTK